MGRGGYLWLVNGTPFSWRKAKPDVNYGQNAWDLPAVLESGESQRFHVKLDKIHAFGREDESAAESLYRIEGTPHEFKIKINRSEGFFVELTDMYTLSEQKGNVIILGLKVKGSVGFIISGMDHENLICSSWNNLRLGWMQNNIGWLGKRKLRSICMPASHDAGMSISGPGRTLFGSDSVTRNHVKNIGDQLRLGVRYFDIRPVISAGKYFTGHYGTISNGRGWQGANGQKMTDIIQQVNDFANFNKELVILQLSHAMNTDDAYRCFNQEEWYRLFDEMKSLNNRYVPRPGDGDLSVKTLNDFIGCNESSVLVLVEMDERKHVLGPFRELGFHTMGEFPVYDEYAESNDVKEMINDQFEKMKQQRTGPDSKMFALDWTLTQKASDVVLQRSILDLAKRANPSLIWNVVNNSSYVSYPNLLSTDLVEDTNPVAVAMAVNVLYAGS